MKKVYRLALLSVSVALLSFLLVNNQPSVSTYSQFRSRGEEVRKIQQVLRNEGFYNGAIDGIYGLKTENGVIRYQQRHGLRVDGIAGNETLTSMGIYSGASSNNNNLNLLARTISGEARGESYEGQVAVGGVIMNRIKHASFPSTIAGVVYQPGAFSVVDDGQINNAPTDSATRAARDALNGYDPSWGSIYYYNPAKATNVWIRSRPIVRVIGEHVFCR